MEFPMTAQYKAAVLRQYREAIAGYPVIRQEVEVFLEGRDDSVSLGVQYLYGHMAAQDVLSIPVEILAGYVEATLEALGTIPYCKTIPAEIFFPYVLYHRVNSEYTDGSRGFLLRELLPHVQGKSMAQAALSVNYWCYAHATYTPADDRTLGPLAVLRRTWGRCGEESVLTVAALRSVGIPARQCYCPRWSHCDDNHAWVEVWIDGSWHYLGACEPEPVLDRGWFTAAASRAMLVDTKCWAGSTLYETVNCTGRYTGTRILTVQVTADGRGVPDALVQFQIVNYSQLYTLWEARTDGDGLARFETGAGDLLVCARHGQRVALKKVDLRQQTSVVLELQPAFPEFFAADLVPPEDCSGAVPHDTSSRHNALLARCEAHLAARRTSFAANTGFFFHAGLNFPEIEAFLADSRYSQTCKEELLDTLRPKDFADITHETLADALDAAVPAREHYPAEIFRKYILCPRIADEMLLPERQKMRALFPAGFGSPQEILAWMHGYMQILPDLGIRSYYPSAYGCLRCRQVPAFAFDAVFAALCRAFCFPARLEPHTQQAQWMDAQGVWHSIRPQEAPVQLTLELPAGRQLHYFEHITLGIWNGNDFTTLQYPELILDGSHTFHLQPGLYRVTVTTRQIDGTASTALYHLNLSHDRHLAIKPPEDQTPQRLQQIPLSLPDGPLSALLQQDSGNNLLLIFADPGSEPTEHLLREMQECAAGFRALGCRILLLTQREAAKAHPTVQQLRAALPGMEISCRWDSGALAALHRQMHMGDLRLPFAICMDRHGNGVYADANYRIRMAQTLLEIQKLLTDRT